jgi:phage terminase large subunit-like protein
VVDSIHASDGKRVRAEPVAGLTEQERHHFAGIEGQALLVDQMCGWDPNEPWSPDRMDAMVHSVTDLSPWLIRQRTRMAQKRRGLVAT